MVACLRIAGFDRIDDDGRDILRNAFPGLQLSLRSFGRLQGFGIGALRAPTLVAELNGGVEEIALNPTRLDQDDAHAKRLHFHTQRIRETFDRILRSAVYSAKGKRHAAKNRSHVHDRARSLLAHAGQHFANQP